jgi:hypothetical protein
MCAWCLGLLECCAFLGSCLLFLSILTLSSLFPWNKVGHVYIKVQQQTTWDEIPEKTNSSSSVTKNTLCSFIKILRAPNPKPGVHWSLNNQVGVPTLKLAWCSIALQFFMFCQMKWRRRRRRRRWSYINSDSEKFSSKQTRPKLNSCS